MPSSGASATIRLQHGIGCAELTTIYRDRPPRFFRCLAAQLATLVVRQGSG
jgi:hypothetical protein